MEYQISFPLKKSTFYMHLNSFDILILQINFFFWKLLVEILESNVGTYISSPYLNRFPPDVVYKSAPSVVPCLSLFTCKVLHILLKNQYVRFAYPITGTAPDTMPCINATRGNIFQWWRHKKDHLCRAGESAGPLRFYAPILYRDHPSADHIILKMM